MLFLTRMQKDYMASELKSEIKKFKKERNKLLREILKIEKEISFFVRQKHFFAKLWKQKIFPHRKRRVKSLKKTLKNTERKLLENEFFVNFFEAVPLET